jgi:HCNGP-like protein
MSALVGYETSSDEEVVPRAASQVTRKLEAPVASPLGAATSRPLHHPELKASQTADSEVAADRPLLGPLLGPAAPINGGIIHAEAPASASETISERDTIRHLTQASVPMTSIPSSPPGSPDPVANTRFARFMKLKAEGVHFNQDLATKPSFLNPGLLAIMMGRAGIDEEDQYNSSLPIHLWDPRTFPPWAYKEELLQSQQDIRDKDDAQKKASSAVGKRTIDFAPSESNSGASSRKSTPGYQKKRRRP